MNTRIKYTMLVMIFSSMSATFVQAQQPAARLGDSTSHGGTIVQGFPTVLINGQPAARNGDFATSPLVIFPVSCVGGPIIATGSTVVIGGVRAARVGDLGVTACGAPQVLVQGSSNVFIGN
jgi:uncharacterized Zn-binding protein involved in type VI secretion